MKEIRARTWDGKQMHHLGLYQCVNDNNDFVLRTDDAEFWIDDSTDFVKQDVMLWTGLIDKNGKNIYENDIVKITVYAILMRIIGKVILKDGCFSCVTPIFPDNDIPLYGAGEIEIIGNIYENPELLEVKR